MSLKTRLDGRSAENSSFELCDENGKLLATIKSAHPTSIALEISTEDGLHIRKPNGWNSKPNQELPCN